MRRDILGRRRSFLTAGVVILGLAALIVPWRGTISAQGLLIANQQSRIFSPRPARIDVIAVRDGQQVAAGDLAFKVSAPDLDRETLQASRRVATGEALLARIAGDETDRANRLVIEGELARDRSTLAGLLKERERLVVKVPGAGIIKDLDPELRPGEWIGDTQPMARLVGQDQPQIAAYVDEQDVRRIVVGAAVAFIPEDVLAPKLAGRVVEISPAGTRALEYVQLASVFGGAVPSDRQPDGDVKPRAGHHLVRIAVAGPPLQQTKRGIVFLEAERESIATAMVRRILQVLIRESGT